MEDKDNNEYTDWQNFGIRVKNARNSIGMTTEKLAEKSNRSENFIQRIENGKSCSIHTLHQLAQALNVTADSLLYGEHAEIIEYADREIIDNILNNCNKKQLKVVKDVLVAICHNFDEFEKEV